MTKNPDRVGAAARWFSPRVVRTKVPTFLADWCLGGGGVSLLEAGAAALNGELVGLALRQAMFQRLWCLVLAMRVARGGE